MVHVSTTSRNGHLIKKKNILPAHEAHVELIKRGKNIKTKPKSLFFIAENTLQDWRHKFTWVTALS